MIVTQTIDAVTVSSRIPKHEGHDRTGDWTSRTKMTQDLGQAINDGLYYYEEDLWTSSRQRVSSKPRIIKIKKNYYKKLNKNDVPKSLLTYKKKHKRLVIKIINV